MLTPVQIKIYRPSGYRDSDPQHFLLHFEYTCHLGLCESCRDVELVEAFVQCREYTE